MECVWLVGHSRKLNCASPQFNKMAEMTESHRLEYSGPIETVGINYYIINIIVII